MAVSKILPVEIPLHRLLKRQPVVALLKEFEALLPGRNLALVGADGHPFVGSAKWSPAELVALLAQGDGGRTVRGAGVSLLPLLVNSHLLGALVTDGVGEEHVLRGLHSSLTLILAQALETRDLVRETLDRYREINLLYNIGEMIGSRLDPQEITHLVLVEANRILEAIAGLVLLPANLGGDTGDLEVRARLGTPDYVEAADRTCRDVIDQVYRSGRPAIATGLAGDPVSLGPILCAPLKTQEQVLGVILLGRRAGGTMFTAGDEKLLMALAGQAAIAIERARLHQEEVKRQRLEEELAIGRQIQLSLLPDACPVVPGWDFAAFYQPARLVGGDLYDFIDLPGEPRQLGLVIADVTDKGVPAALFMAFSRTIIRTESTSSRKHNPATTLMRANRSIVRDIRSASRLFLSAFYAILDPHSGRLAYANGGHNWPLWVRAATREVQPLRARGMLLGIFPDIELEEHEIEVAPGDLIVFYTDGVTEARNVDGDMFEEERLGSVAAANPEASAQQVVQSIVEAVQSFIGSAPQSDDLTLFVVKRQRP